MTDTDSRRELARCLRSEGLLLKEIAADLGVSVVTIHRWVRDLPIPKSARPGGDAQHMHMMRRAYWDRELRRRDEERQAAHAEAAAHVPPLGNTELLMLGAVAYWCEGSKGKPWRRQEHLDFINSDPGLIRLFLALLKQEGVQAHQLRFTVSIHAKADVAAAETFWAGVVGVPRSDFRPASLKRHNPKTVRKNVAQTYVGCLCIGVRDSKRLYQRIEGTWQGIMARVAEGDDMRQSRVV